MAVRICLVCVVALALIAASGCDPYETEITLNPDGSGVMTQKLTLSPLGAMVLKQMRVRNQGGPSTQVKLPTTEAEALKWNEDHPDAGVRVESFSSEPAGEARKIAFRVSFDSLEKLSVTEWGWPLAASASEKDGGTVLTVNDPLRRVIQASLGSELEDNDDEATALFDGGGMVTADARVRVLLNLPVAAKSAEGAELSADGKQVVYDAVPGGSVARFQEWVRTGPFSVQLPAEIAVKTFMTPSVPFSGAPQLVAVKEPAELAVAATDGEGMVELKDFEYRLTSVNYNRSLNFQNQQPGAEPGRSENVGLSFQLYGPEGVEIFREYSGNSQTASLDMLSALKDQDGNDLRGDRTNMNCYLQGGSWRNDNMDKAQYHGSFSISFAPKPGATSLSLVEGYVVADVVLKKETLEVEPVPANLNKVFEIGDATLEFTDFSLPRIKYRWTPATLGLNYPNRGAPAVVGEDGKEMRFTDRSLSRDDKAWTITENFNGNLAPGEKLIITYAAKSAKVKLPFKLENVPLP